MSRNVLDGKLVFESVNNVFSLDFLNFALSVLHDELVNMHETSTDSHEYLITLFNFDINPLLSKLIDTLGFSQEHDSHLVALRESVKIIRQSFVNFVIFLGDVNCLVLLKSFIEVKEF